MGALIGRAFAALARAAAFAAQAFVALVVSLAAAILAVAGALAALVSLAARLVADIAPGLVRLSIAGALVGAVVWTWPVAWGAFGADMAAMIPASMLVLLPVAWALARRAGWGGLLGALIVIMGSAFVLSVVTQPVAHLLIVALLVASVFESVGKRGKHYVRLSEAAQERRADDSSGG